MNYLIIDKSGVPFYTNWYSFENNYVKGMIVIDFYKNLYTKNGKDWIKIEKDHL